MITAAQIDTLIARTAARLIPWDAEPVTGVGALVGRLLAELHAQPLKKWRDYVFSAIRCDGASDADFGLWGAVMRMSIRMHEVGSPLLPTDPRTLLCIADCYAAIRSDPSIVVSALARCAPRPPPELRPDAPRRRRKARRSTIHDPALGSA